MECFGGNEIKELLRHKNESQLKISFNKRDLGGMALVYSNECPAFMAFFLDLMSGVAIFEKNLRISKKPFSNARSSSIFVIYFYEDSQPRTSIQGSQKLCQSIIKNVASFAYEMLHINYPQNMQMNPSISQQSTPFSIWFAVRYITNIYTP